MDAIVGSLVVILLLWVGLALGCAFGAKSIMLGKGRSGTAGFWLGLCLGLTGLLIAALLSATPEHEARKMQMQMQMMGIAPPPPGVAYPAGHAPPASFGVPPRTKSSTVNPSVIIAIVVSAGYAMAWLAFSNYAFRYRFGSLTELALLIFVASLALAIAAQVKKSALLVGLASGVALGICGVGLLGLGGVVGNWGLNASHLIALPFDIGAFVGAVLIVRSASMSPPPATAVTWWKHAALGLGGAGVLLTLAASQPLGPDLLVGNSFVWGGFVIATLGLLKGGRAPLALAIGWSGVTVVDLVLNDFRGLFGREATTLEQLLMVVAGAMGGLAIWAFRQTQSDEHAGPGAPAAMVAPSPFDAVPATAPAPPPPPLMTAFAPAPAPAPAAAPLVVVPGAPAPMVVVPSVPQLLSPPVDATMPRARAAGAASLRFATGEVVALTSNLIVGRAPVAPARLAGSQTFTVDDPSFTISSTHCLLSLVDGGVWVEDLGSTNGTEVVSAAGATELGAGQRMLLTPSDRVQLGDNWCRVE